jgi:sugar lactone lactonase YvrE
MHDQGARRARQHWLKWLTAGMATLWARTLGNGNTQKLFALSAALALMILGVGRAGTQNEVEDFETGDLSKFAWETGGDAPWSVTSEEKHSGAFSAQAGKLGEKGRSWLQVNLFVDEGQIIFWFKMETEGVLIFSIDGQERAKRHGERGWQEVAYSLEWGLHTFRWEFLKYNSRAMGKDSVWIDDITFPPIRPERLTSCPPAMPFAFCRLQPPSSSGGGVLSVSFSPDGRLLASGSYDSTVKLWDVVAGKELRALTGHTTLVNSVAFSPDGKLLASSGAGEGTVRIWDVATGELVRTFRVPDFFVVNVAFSPDGKWIAAASNNSRTGVKFWDVATGSEIRTLFGVQYPIAFSPDNAYFAASSCGARVGPGACTQGRISLFDAVTGTAIRSFAGHTGALTIEGLAFSPDGKWLASGSCMLLPDPATPGCDYDETKLWEVATGKEVRTLRNRQSRTFGADSVAFSPDSKLLVSALGPNTIALWEVTTGSERRTFRSPFGSRSVKFSPDGQLLASGGFAGPLLFYVGDLGN